MRRLAALIVITALVVPAVVYAAPKITGADVVDGSLTGADINEATLGKVPAAEVADRLATPVLGYTSETFFVPARFSGPSFVTEAPPGRVAVGCYVSDEAPATRFGVEIDHFSQACVTTAFNPDEDDEFTLTVVHVPEASP
jgi:hypothetical protein